MEVQNIEVQNVISKPVFMISGITSGRTISPMRGIVYGDNGIGKTSTLACAMKPIIMNMEGNCDHIDCDKKRIIKFEDFHGLLNDLLIQPHDYKTLIPDSLDSVQTILNEKIMNSYSLKQLSYGKDAAIWKMYIKEIMDKIEKLNTIKRMNILFTAHSKVKAVNNPMTEAYDRYDLRINEEMRTGFCNWAQFIVFAQKEVILEEEETSFGKKKAKSLVRRAWYTQGDPTYYGKNVFNLPKKISMRETPQEGWEQFANHVKNFYNK